MLACPSGRFAQVSLREWVRLEGEWLGPWDSNPRPLFGSLRRVPRSRHSTAVLGSRSGCPPGRSSRAQSVGWMPRAAPSVEQWGRPVGVTVAPDARCWCPTTAATESGGLPRRPLRGDDDETGNPHGYPGSPTRRGRVFNVERPLRGFGVVRRVTAIDRPDSTRRFACSSTPIPQQLTAISVANNLRLLASGSNR